MEENCKECKNPQVWSELGKIEKSTAGILYNHVCALEKKLSCVMCAPLIKCEEAKMEPNLCELATRIRAVRKGLENICETLGDFRARLEV